MSAILTLLIGSLSAIAPKLLDHFGRRQDNAQEFRMLELQLNSAENVAAIHMDTSAQEGANASYAASLSHDSAAAEAMNKNSNFIIRFMSGLMNIWRAAIRPGITTTPS